MRPDTAAHPLQSSAAQPPQSSAAQPAQPPQAELRRGRDGGIYSRAAFFDWYGTEADQEYPEGFGEEADDGVPPEDGEAPEEGEGADEDGLGHQKECKQQ